MKDSLTQLMTHLVAGYPSAEASVERAKIMAQAGVGMIEVQLPFSDPIADGPAIATANVEALAGGTDISQALDITKRIVAEAGVLVITICYYNTVYRFGVEAFIKKLASIGVTGVTVPDVAVDSNEGKALHAACKQFGLAYIHMLAPNTPAERMRSIVQQAAEGLAVNPHAYIYCQARFGTTGKRTSIDEQLEAYLTRVKEVIRDTLPVGEHMPIALGFGISTPEQVSAVAKGVDIVVVGTALLNVPADTLEQNVQNLLSAV